MFARWGGGGSRLSFDRSVIQIWFFRSRLFPSPLDPLIDRDQIILTLNINKSQVSKFIMYGSCNFQVGFGPLPLPYRTAHTPWPTISFNTLFMLNKLLTSINYCKRIIEMSLFQYINNEQLDKVLIKKYLNRILVW